MDIQRSGYMGLVVDYFVMSLMGTVWPRRAPRNP